MTTPKLESPQRDHDVPPPSPPPASGCFTCFACSLAGKLDTEFATVRRRIFLLTEENRGEDKEITSSQDQVRSGKSDSIGSMSERSGSEVESSAGDMQEVLDNSQEYQSSKEGGLSVSDYLPDEHDVFSPVSVRQSPSIIVEFIDDMKLLHVAGRRLSSEIAGEETTSKLIQESKSSEEVVLVEEVIPEVSLEETLNNEAPQPGARKETEDEKISEIHSGKIHESVVDIERGKELVDAESDDEMKNFIIGSSSNSLVETILTGDENLSPNSFSLVEENSSAVSFEVDLLSFIDGQLDKIPITEKEEVKTAAIKNDCSKLANFQNVSEDNETSDDLFHERTVGKSANCVLAQAEDRSSSSAFEEIRGAIRSTTEIQDSTSGASRPALENEENFVEENITELIEEEIVESPSSASEATKNTINLMQINSASEILIDSKIEVIQFDMENMENLVEDDNAITELSVKETVVLDDDEKYWNTVPNSRSQNLDTVISQNVGTSFSDETESCFVEHEKNCENLDNSVISVAHELTKAVLASVTQQFINPTVSKAACYNGNLNGDINSDDDEEDDDDDDDDRGGDSHSQSWEKPSLLASGHPVTADDVESELISSGPVFTPPETDQITCPLLSSTSTVEVNEKCREWVNSSSTCDELLNSGIEMGDSEDEEDGEEEIKDPGLGDQIKVSLEISEERADELGVFTISQNITTCDEDYDKLKKDEFGGVEPDSTQVEKFEEEIAICSLIKSGSAEEVTSIPVVDSHDTDRNEIVANTFETCNETQVSSTQGESSISAFGFRRGESPNLSLPDFDLLSGLSAKKNSRKRNQSVDDQALSESGTPDGDSGYAASSAPTTPLDMSKNRNREAFRAVFGIEEDISVGHAKF